MRLLDDEQALVNKVKLIGIDKKFKEEASEYIQEELRPNSFINLFIYNLANGQKGQYRKRKIRRVGEAPSILDSTLVDISTTQIQKYLLSKGFLEAKATSRMLVHKKKATIFFDIDQGLPFTIKKITYDIEDPNVDSIYQKFNLKLTKLHKGSRYDTDSLVSERESIYELMQREGYFDFLRQYVRFEVDTNFTGNELELKLVIENPENKNKHLVFYIDSSIVTIQNSAESTLTSAKSTSLGENVKFIDYTNKFKGKRLSRFLFMKENSRYNINYENLTYDRLYQLNSFKSIKIEYKKTDSTHLNAYYNLIPSKRMSNRLEGEYTFNAGRNGFNIGNTYTNRNFLGGAEQLEVKLSYGVLFDSRVSGSIIDKVFNEDIQLGATLTFPRLLIPFRTSPVVKNGMPRTAFSTSWQKFDQLRTYSNRYFINSLSYIWNDTKYKVHNLTPIALEYRVGKLSAQFKNQLIKEGFGFYVASNDRAYLGLGSQYSYTFNTIRLNELAKFIYFRGTLDVSGNSLSLLGKLLKFPQNSDGQKTILNVPFLQYVKAETDFRSYHTFGGDRQLVVRLNPGIAIPYGNNIDFLVFEKSFYGGGMNSIRAWQARTLGPGGYNRDVVPDSLRLNLRNLDQLGEIKLEGNIEYRFKLINSLFGAKLKGATFVDVGNIWRLNENTINPNGKFKANTFLGQMAIGTGLGLRFDVDYFVFRLDAGLKVRDPQFEGKNRWVISELFDSKRFREAYNTTHFPDRYNFIQYNFGIGMPF